VRSDGATVERRPIVGYIVEIGALHDVRDTLGARTALDGRAGPRAASTSPAATARHATTAHARDQSLEERLISGGRRIDERLLTRVVDALPAECNLRRWRRMPIAEPVDVVVAAAYYHNRPVAKHCPVVDQCERDDGGLYRRNESAIIDLEESSLLRRV